MQGECRGNTQVQGLGDETFRNVGAWGRFYGDFGFGAGMG